MSKELIISITPQETKAAILENDQVIEIHIERDKDQGIVGAICKGRVTKVLPGMQSAFVDIGLERDAFLYVSDFFEDTEEYDKLVTTAEEQVAKLEQSSKTDVAPLPFSPPVPVDVVASNVLRYQDRHGRSRRSRRNRLKGKRFDIGIGSAENQQPPRDPVVTDPPREADNEPSISILPGESLAKYQNIVPPPGSPTSEIEKPSLAIRQTTQPDPTLLIDDVVVLSSTSEDQATTPISFPYDDLETSKDPSSNREETGVDLNLPWTTDTQNLEEKIENGLEGVRHFTSVLTDESETLPQEPTVENSLADNGDSDSDEESNEAVTSQSPEATFGEGDEKPETANETGFLEKTEAPASIPLGQSSDARPSKAQFRNAPGTARFFRRNMEGRRPQHNFSEDRKESVKGTDYPLIGDLLKQGQEILVQISKEPLGSKGARITSHIALPGRYLVYMPTVDHIGVSRKIESDEERQRLKRIIQENCRNLPGGFIVRTAGQGRGEEEFKSDINFLYALWAEIKTRADKKGAATIIHRDLNLVQRILRDQLSADFSTIRVDNELEYAAIVEFINRFQPSLVNRVKLYIKDTPIFEEFGVQSEIERALRSKVWLKSGGYIVIDQAEALVAIDVNTGKYVGRSNKLEDTIVKTNIEAAKEIAHQIRLRDLGGIIVCDFIDMEDRKNRQKVTQTLEEALRSDKSPSKILQFNDFGLVAITRKRVKQSLLKILCEPCPTCIGSGMVKSPQTVCYEILGEIKKMAKTLENREITIRANSEVAKALKTSEAAVIREIESTLKKEVVIKSDSLLHQEHFDIF